MNELDKLNEAVDVIKRKLCGFAPVVSITLGSGLGRMTDFLAGSRVPYSGPGSLLYSEIPFCPLPLATGHEGCLHWGELCGVPVIMLSGRVHCYDGYNVHDVVFLTRAMIMFGCKKLIITHAVGAVTKNLDPCDIVAVRSHIAFDCPDPTAGFGIQAIAKGREFTPMGDAYSRRFLALAKKCALQQGVSLHWGVSHFKFGRTYETEAEVELMRRAGADVATMSTIPEVIAAAHMGAEVLDLALVTNMGAGLGSTVPLSHQEVQTVADQMKKPFGDLITSVVKEMKDM